MRRRTHKGNSKKKTPILTRKMNIKMSIFFLIVILLMTLLMGKVLWINYTKGDIYTKEVLSNSKYSSKTLPFKRGDITDRNGVILATSVKHYNLILDPKVINSKEEYADVTVKALTECFGFNGDELRQIIAERKNSSYVVYKKHLTYEEISGFLELSGVKGVWFEEEYVRKYPFDSLASGVIGFTTAGNVGNWGIEGYYNSVLNGLDGRQYGYVDDTNSMESVTKDPVNGSTVVSTIDFNIQRIVEKYINIWNEEYSPQNIGVIISNPNNGEVLAMAGSVRYDLNNPRDLSQFYTEEQIAAMTDEEQVNALSKMWRNFCISDSYEPGSTMKPFTVATALEENFVSKSEEFDCDGYEIVAGEKIKCHKHEGHGHITLTDAISKSCNDAMMKIADKLGAKLFTGYQTRFGFGQLTGIDLPGEENCANLIYTADNMDVVSLATNSFGQNINVTMIQMVASFSSLINGGYYYEPHIVKKLINPSGGVSETIDTTLVKHTITEDVSKYLRKAMRETVTEGSGKAAAIAGYEIAGKTGTAQKYPREDEKYLVSFMGFVPYDSPELLCYVIVDDPNTEKSLSSVSSTLFKSIMEEVLSYMNIFPTENGGSDNPDGNPDDGGDDYVQPPLT